MAKTGLKLTELTDPQLVELALKGESQAPFFTLYARYHSGIHAHVSKFVTEQEDIEDICMESFEKAFKQLATYRPENKFSTWLLTIARNTAFDHKDRSKSKGRNVETTSLSVPDLSGVDVPDEAKNPIDEIIDSQIHENFVQCIEGLPELYREIARLCFVDNLGYREISEKTGLQINSVKTRIRRAKDQLSKMMLDMEEQ